MLKSICLGFLGWPILVRIAAAASTPVVVVGLLLAVVPRFTQLPADVAFRVYGQDVTIAQLQHRLTVLKALYGITPPADPAAQDTFRRTSAEAVVTSMVIDRSAETEHTAVSDKDGRDALGKFVATFPDGVNGFARMLGTVGATESDVIDELTRQQNTRLLYNKVTAQQGARAVVTPGEAQAYYDQHADQFVLPETRHLRNIVVDSRDEADQIVQQARAGADFATLAQQNSLDQSTSAAGGDLGLVSRDQLEPAFAAVAFAAAPATVFGPVRTEQGWAIGRVLDVHPAGRQSFPQVSTQLIDWLTAQRGLAHWRGWLAGQLNAAHVSYADAYRPAQPALGAASAGPGAGTTGVPASPAAPELAAPAPAPPAHH